MVGWVILVMVPVVYAMIAFGGWLSAKLECSGHKAGSWVFTVTWALVIGGTCMLIGSWGEW